MDEQGSKVPIPEVVFRRENGIWVSILGPLGCIPVPGETLIPRDTMFLDVSGEEYLRKNRELTNDTLVEAVVAGLRQAPLRGESAPWEVKRAHHRPGIDLRRHRCAA